MRWASRPVPEVEALRDARLLRALRDDQDDAFVADLAVRLLGLRGPDAVPAGPVEALGREVRRVVALVAAGGRPDELDQARYTRRAFLHGVLCTRANVEPATLLIAYETAFAAVLERLWNTAAARLDVVSRGLTGRCARWLTRVCRAACDGAAAELARTARTGEAVATLARVMLLGHDGGQLVGCAGVAPAPAHRLLVGVCESVPAPWQSPSFTADLVGPSPVLHCVVDGDLVLLLPAARAVDLRTTRASARTGAPDVWWAASEPAPVERLATAARKARSTARLAYAAALPPGRVTTTEEVVVEALSLYDPALRSWLDEIAELLGGDPDLRRTVAALYAADLDRADAAQRLGIARRTLNSRLDRVRRLTGLGPTTSTGIQVLGLALAAGRLAAMTDRRSA